MIAHCSCVVWAPKTVLRVGTWSLMVDCPARPSSIHCKDKGPSSVPLLFPLRRIKASAGCYGNFLYQTHPLFTLWADYVNEWMCHFLRMYM